MLISREADYAIRLIRAMQDGKIHSMKPMCEAEDIPWKFAYKIIGKLRAAGIVRTAAGVHGGCQVIRDLHEVTVWDVLQATEDKGFLIACLEPDFDCGWVQKKCRSCAVNRKLRVLERKMRDLLKSISMADLLDEGRELSV